MFAFALEVLDNVQMATFAAFGGFATLVLVSFGGSRRDKLAAHVAFAIVGSVLLTIGTAVTSSTALAAIVTLPVAFVVFFAGVAGPNAAAAVNGALLIYVLPAASPGTLSMVPDRLAGWWLASVAGTTAVLVLSPTARGDQLRAAAANAAECLVAAIQAALDGAPAQQPLNDAIEAKHELLAAFNATPYRPTGLTAPDEALANAIELLEWCTSLVADMVRERPDITGARANERELLEAAVGTLRDVGLLFRGGREPAGHRALASARERSIAQLEDRSTEGAIDGADARLAFHADMIAVAALSLAADAEVAAHVADPAWLGRHGEAAPAGPAAVRRARRRLAAIAGVARRQASVRSVWLVNSLRGATALAVAVAVADLSSVQHGFWVVLGTLSVLRTNAVATGATALRALVGTAIGFAIGGLLLVAIGASSVALWAILPIAVFVAAYTPGTAPFALGQAAFTVTVAVLFNLLVPAGWHVGVIRIEDVAIGCAVSVVVGLLFWPRGLAAVVGDDLADAFRTGAYHLRQAVQWAANAQEEMPEGAQPASAAAARLDEALRGFLAEQGSKQLELQELWRLVGGALRLRLTALSIAELPPDAMLVGSAQAALMRRTATLSAWFERLARVVGRRTEPPPLTLSPPTFGPDEAVTTASGSHYGVWLCEHLDHLAEHLAELVTPAIRVAEARRGPWWR